jgi:hypothetical protein
MWWRGPYRTASEFIEATWLPFLRMYENEITTPDLALAVYLIGPGRRSVIRSILEDVPTKLEASSLFDSLVAMAVGCLCPTAPD